MQEAANSCNSTGHFWYNDPKFSTFWKHYEVFMSSHRNALSASVNHMTNCSLQSRLYFPPHQHRYSATSLNHRVNSHNSYSCSGKRRRKRRKRQENERHVSSTLQLHKQAGEDSDVLNSCLAQGMHLQDSSEDEDFTENKEFLAFLMESEKHRAEWRARKALALNAKESVKHTEEPEEEKEHPDVIRSREMKLLYGISSSRIHAMETSVQLSFDRFSTMHQPQFWPIVPLKLIF